MLCFQNGTIEMSINHLQARLKKMVDYQKFYRFREMHGRRFAEDLNARVFFWAGVQTASIIIISVGSVIIVKTFFSIKAPKGLITI